MNTKKHYIIICILFFLSAICSAQIEKLSIEKVSLFLLQKKNIDSLSKLNIKYQLVIESNINTYYPATDTSAYIKCRFVNKSKNTVLIDTLIFKNFMLSTCNHRWPLHMWEFEIPAIKNSSYKLKPNEEILVFSATLKKLCFSDKYMWDWSGHPSPPKSPIHVPFSGQEEYLNETCLYFSYNIDGVIVLSNILKLKVKKKQWTRKQRL